MKVGNKVTHINTGSAIHTIKRILGLVCTCELDESMKKPLYKNSKSSPIVDVMVCKIENLKKIL